MYDRFCSGKYRPLDRQRLLLISDCRLMQTTPGAGMFRSRWSQMLTWMLWNSPRFRGMFRSLHGVLELPNKQADVVSTRGSTSADVGPRVETTSAGRGSWSLANDPDKLCAVVDKRRWANAVQGGPALIQPVRINRIVEMTEQGVPFWWSTIHPLKVSLTKANSCRNYRMPCSSAENSRPTTLSWYAWPIHVYCKLLAVFTNQYSAVLHFEYLDYSTDSVNLSVINIADLIITPNIPTCKP